MKKKERLPCRESWKEWLTLLSLNTEWDNPHWRIQRDVRGRAGPWQKEEEAQVGAMGTLANFCPTLLRMSELQPFLWFSVFANRMRLTAFVSLNFHIISHLQVEKCYFLQSVDHLQEGLFTESPCQVLGWEHRGGDVSSLPKSKPSDVHPSPVLNTFILVGSQRSRVLFCLF